MPGLRERIPSWETLSSLVGSLPGIFLADASRDLLRPRRKPMTPP
eukprot:CAMPEP_0185819890 /NCGR_PEP_ID=MMETSP1322-20130828/22923_1 /TAXON_ID=265543 /ORGANISM="Minutocellus polymorphus, Strain RCC2270" /LENGTH=44 /DNA_ID= /DNA_START= /DNA_END= /DNA_ORIENTATION=